MEKAILKQRLRGLLALGMMISLLISACMTAAAAGYGSEEVISGRIPVVYPGDTITASFESGCNFILKRNGVEYGRYNLGEIATIPDNSSSYYYGYDVSVIRSALIDTYTVEALAEDESLDGVEELALNTSDTSEFSELELTERLRTYTIQYFIDGVLYDTQSVSLYHTLVSELSKPGAAVYGWNTAADGTGQTFELGAAVAEGLLDHGNSENGYTINLYLQYSPYIMSINYFANCDSYTGEMTGAVLNYGNSAALTANQYAREGYVFGGWNTAADGSGIAYADGQTVSFTAEGATELNLYAQWKQIETKPETEPATKPETEPAAKPETEPATKPETEPATQPETELETAEETETESETVQVVRPKENKTKSMPQVVQPVQTAASGPEAAQTGDETNQKLYVTLMLISMLTMLIVWRKKRV